jgi:hypothetical protein
MPGVRWNQDGIAGADVAGITVDLHGSLPFEDEVELFAELVVVALGRLADGDSGLGEALILYGRVGPVQDAADGAAVLGGERWLVGKRVDRHGLPPSLNSEARSVTRKCSKMNLRGCQATSPSSDEEWDERSEDSSSPMAVRISLAE